MGETGRGMSGDVLISLKNIDKFFGKVHCLKNINLDIRRAESIGLVGDNGAGKSTLIKIMSGFHTAEKGEIFWEGKKVKLTMPKAARTLGVETVYQEQALAPHLSIARNIFMGREISRGGGFLDEKAMDEESMNALKGLGLNIRSSEIPVSKLSGGERQGVAIARALYFNAKLVILDEPTVALAVKEVQEVLEFIRHMKSEGIAVIFITHNLHHVYSVADRIIVLSRGEVIGDIMTKDTDVDKLSDLIVSSTMGKLV